MIRNNLHQTPSSISTTTTDDNLLNLPDLSAFGDEEKQHILNVLVRDETLRHKHLARFMYVQRGSTKFLLRPRLRLLFQPEAKI